MIEVRDLVFEYPAKRALDGVSFAVAPQTITALVGPNGAGKTTLLRCLAALEMPYSGSVAIGGLDTREAPRKIHEKLGYLPDFSVFMTTSACAAVCCTRRGRMVLPQRSPMRPWRRQRHASA